jgi:hypothetical protein
MGILLLAGCATNVKKPEVTQNPPPEMAFSRFTSFELRPINTAEGCSKQHGADEALRSVQERLNNRLTPVVAQWNATAANGQAHKLLIEPVCSDAKLIGTTARVFGGALHGSSAIVMKVRYTDASTGKLVAEPVFYQRAAAMAGAFSFGGADRAMLERVAELVADYTVNNYKSAVGGPTGLE